MAARVPTRGLPLSGLMKLSTIPATKCISKHHGYEKTLAGVDSSLEKIPGGTISANITALTSLILPLYRLHRSIPNP